MVAAAQLKVETTSLVKYDISSKIKKVTPPSIIVVFGASGDLAKRKIFPSLYNILKEDRLPRDFAVVGFARTQKEIEAFRREVKEGVKEFSRLKPFDERVWRVFSSRLFYVVGNYDNKEDFVKLSLFLKKIDSNEDCLGNRLFYLATPYNTFSGIVKNLYEVGELREKDGGCFRRIVIEKPFGHNFDSARELNNKLTSLIKESQIYRIDHYLGKETVQNILVFRFANSIFEQIWNNKFIDSVQITVAEGLGVEGRAEFYDQTGALRDMVVNHLFQLLCLTCMEAPPGLDADEVRDEKLKVLKAIRIPSSKDVKENCIRGQYTAGRIDGKRVVGYLDEEGVKKNSRMESFVALKLFIDNWRWDGVPFYLRTGKRIERKRSEIVINFKPPPCVLFNENCSGAILPNSLTIRVQPEEGITLEINSKEPGNTFNALPVDMTFSYEAEFERPSPDAYERLILDSLRGDLSLFTRRDEIEQAWKIVDSIREVWDRDRSKLPSYPAGSWGPVEADELIKRNGRRWRESVDKITRAMLKRR